MRPEIILRNHGTVYFYTHTFHSQLSCSFSCLFFPFSLHHHNSHPSTSPLHYPTSLSLPSSFDRVVVLFSCSPIRELKHCLAPDYFKPLAHRLRYPQIFVCLCSIYRRLRLPQIVFRSASPHSHCHHLPHPTNINNT